MSCVVSISDRSGKVCGSGFLVSPIEVLTCAHVVNTALDRQVRSTAKPDHTSKVQVRFAGAGGVTVAAAVMPDADAWSAPPADRASGSDICRLVLDAAAPCGATPGRLVQRCFIAPFDVWVSGYPEDWNARATSPQLDTAEARVLGVDQNLWLLRSDSAARSASIATKTRSAGLIYSGFSGAPVQAESEIVGMVAQVRDTKGDATCYAIPTSAFPASVLNRFALPPPTESPTLNILPLQGVNFVTLEPEKYVENGRFHFSLRANLISDRYPFVMLGFGAHYIAPDGCYCLPGDKTIQVDGVAVLTAGNDRDFRTPISTTGVVQVLYGRYSRPPLMIQQPADCDYGDLLVEVHIHWGGAINRSEIIERYFSFEIGGDLAPRAAPRPPPILSDLLLASMLKAGTMSQAEFDRANFLTERDRYRVVRFPDYIRKANPSGYSDWEVQPEYRDFLFELHQRALAQN